jgi:hypothetical protein
MTAPDDAQLAEWRASHKMYERAASVIATWARGKERGTVLPDNSLFQRSLAEITGDEPSPSVWKRAKNYLVTQGVLSKVDGPFQVALRPLDHLSTVRECERMSEKCYPSGMTKHDLSGLADLIKASEAARLLRVTPRTLARWSDTGVLPEPVRVGPGARRYYYVADVEALLETTEH